MVSCSSRRLHVRSGRKRTTAEMIPCLLRERSLFLEKFTVPLEENLYSPSLLIIGRTVALEANDESAPSMTALIGVGASGRVLARPPASPSRGRDPLLLRWSQSGSPCRVSGADGCLATTMSTVCWRTRILLRSHQRCQTSCILPLRTELPPPERCCIEKPIANTMTDALAIPALENAHGVRIVDRPLCAVARWR